MDTNAPVAPAVTITSIEDPYLDPLPAIKGYYETGKRSFRIEGLAYSWEAPPEGRHLVLKMVANDRLWITSPQMVLQTRNLLAWARSHPDVTIIVTEDGMLKNAVAAALDPKPLIDGKWKDVGGFLWPCHDNVSAALILAEAGLGHINMALRGVTDFKIAVQAGGNVGVFPVRLASHFKWVYTFEPVAELRECLTKNIKRFGARNVVVSEYALGKERGTASMATVVGNSGSGQITEPVVGGSADEVFGVIPLDTLKLDACGLIWLDVNGTEALVLEGAKETIQKFRPVIVAEDGELSQRYGLPKFAASHYLSTLDYVKIGNIGPDTVFRPIERAGSAS